MTNVKVPACTPLLVTPDVYNTLVDPSVLMPSLLGSVIIYNGCPVPLFVNLYVLPLYNVSSGFLTFSL